jgi:four helix bundle protein
MKQDKWILKDKSINFALRIVNLYKYLSDNKHEYVIGKQILRSGTAIGAIVHEAEFAQSDADYIHKLSIGLKEANETNYWLLLLKEICINGVEYNSLHQDCDEIISIATIKTMKQKTNRVKS